MMLCATLLMVSLGSCNFITADDVDASGNLITEAETTAKVNENAIDMNTNYEVFEEENNNFFSYMTFSEDNVQLSGEPVTDGTNNYFYFKLGMIKNVPVFIDDIATMHDGKTETVYEWRQASITDNIFAQMQ